MKKITFTKKTLALLLALAMVVSGIYIPRSNVKIVQAAEDETETIEDVEVIETVEGIEGDTTDVANAGARIGDAYFTTFQVAVAAARDASSDVTIKLLKDATVSAVIVVGNSNKKTVTIDGNNKAYTITTSIANAMQVEDVDTTVVFQNVKMNHSGSQATIRVEQSAALKLKNVEINATGTTNYQYALINLLGVDDPTGTEASAVQKEEMTLVMEDVTVSMDNVTVKDGNSEVNALVRTGNGKDVGAKIVHLNMTRCTLDASTSAGVHAVLTPGTTELYATMEDCTFKTNNTVPLQLNGTSSVDKTRCSISIASTSNLKHYNTSNTKELFTTTHTATGAKPVAQVGKTLFTDLASAISAATAGKTVDLLADINVGTSNQGDSTTGRISITKEITIDGNNHEITTYAKHAIYVNYAGSVTLKNMNIDSYQYQSVIQVDKAAQLTMSDVDIVTTSTNTNYYKYAIITVPATGSGIELDLTRVDVTMTTGAYGANEHAVIRTGNNDHAAKEVAITLTDCNWNLTGADDRIGIMIMATTTATIVLDNSKIQTLNAVPIFVNAASTGTTIEKKNGTTFSCNEKEAQIGNTLYQYFEHPTDTNATDAVKAANSATKDVAIEILKDIDRTFATAGDSNAFSFTNATSSIAIDGNNHTFTAANGNNTFRFNSGHVGNIALKNMTIDHRNYGAAIQVLTGATVNGDVTTGGTVTIENVTINATKPGSNQYGYEYALINLLNGKDVVLNMKNVRATMETSKTGHGSDVAIIRTGNTGDEKNVTMILEDCILNSRGATKRYGILIMDKTTADITLKGTTKIETNNVAPIMNKATKEQIVRVEGCTFDSVDAGLKNNPFSGFDAQVGNKVYGVFATAISEAEAGSTVEVLRDLSTGWRDITKSMTIDGNGYEITSTAGDATNKFLFVVKDDATEFKLKDLDIKHLRRGMVVRTDIPTTVTLENVDIDATEAPVSTEFALFNLTAEGTTNLIWNDVTVDMDATTAGSDANPAIIRTGNAGSKTVNITLTDCNLNTEGAAGRHGIVIMSGATATLNLTGTTITTLDVVPIKDNTGNATINTTDCTLTYTGIEAIIGDNLYKTFADALEAANASETDVTIEILKDISIDAGNTIANEKGHSITIEGHNHVLTGADGRHTFIIQEPQTGAVELKNMTIVHKNYGSAVQIVDDITADKITVKLTDVIIDATQPQDTTNGYQHAIINVLNKKTTDLILTGFEVTMSTELPGAEVSPYWGIIRTGNPGTNNAKTVNMTLTNCTLNSSGATGRHGIVVVANTTANIVLQNTTITSGDVAPIKNHASTSQTITLEGCTFDATTEAYKTAPIEGYEAQVENVVYGKFADARVAANNAEESVTLKLLANLTVTQNVYINNANGKPITFDGNGYSVTTEGGDNVHAFLIGKVCTVKFENMTVYHKNMGSFIQVQSGYNGVSLSLENVTIHANNPENTESNYRYALINLFSSTTLNLTDVTVDMDSTNKGKDFPGIVRTGNHTDAEKTVTINVNGGNWNTEGATGRHGIVIMKTTNAEVNLIGATITTADVAPIADYSLKAVVTRDESTETTCAGNYEAYVIDGATNQHKIYATFTEALEVANKATSDVLLGLLKDVTVEVAVDKVIHIGNANGKMFIEGNACTMTITGGNNAFNVNKAKEVEFRNMTINHKCYGSAIQVNAVGAELTLTNVFINAGFASELANAAKTYNYTVINLLQSSTLNMKDSKIVMVVGVVGATENRSSLLRTGNTDKVDGTYKEITINLTNSLLDATQARYRNGILIEDAEVQLNLKDGTKILTPTEGEGDKRAAIRGSEGTRRATISMGRDCVLMTGTSTAYADVVKDLESSGMTDACTWTYEWYENLTTFRTESGLKAPTVVPSGYIFAGWYTDKACTKESALDNEDVTTASAYAKFVPKHVLDVKAQISANLLDSVDAGEKGDIRFVTTVDGLDYEIVGFTYSIVLDGQVLKSGISNSAKVYRTLYAVGQTGGEKISYTPEYEFCAESQYFKTMTIKNVPQSAFGAEITVTPFWETLDGTMVYGEPVTKTVQQGIDAHDEDGNVTDAPETASDYTNRVVMVSDLHYTTSLDKKTYDENNKKYLLGFMEKYNPNASWAAGNAFGYTQEQKIQAALDDIHAYGASVGGNINAVMVLGDLTLDDYGYRNLVDDYLDDFKTNFMNKLQYQPYAIAGNHDSYTNDEWENTIGTKRQYSVKIGNAAFIMLDTFAAQHATSGDGSAYVGIDVDWLETELEKYPTETIFLCSHYYQEGKHPEKDAALNALMKQNPRIVSLFRAHSHKNTVKNPATLAGAPIVDIGGYAYNGQKEDDGSYDFNIFNESWAWGYQVVEWNEDEVHIYHVKPARDYTDSAGKVHNYKGAIEGDIVIKLK